MLALLAIALLAQTGCGRSGERCRGMRAERPTAGARLGSNCACQQVASKVVVRGRPDTAENSKTDFCSLSGSFDTASAGDFVSCGINTPRVMNNAVLVEPTGSPSIRINYLDNASQFDSADWVKLSVTAAAPVVVADQATGPQGTATADLVTFAATAAGELSALTKSTGSGTIGRCPPSVSHASAQIMIKGTTLDGGATSGTLDMGIYDGAAWHSVTCAYTSSWARCKNEDQATGANGDFYFGNGTLVTGTTRPGQSVYLALAGCEEGANASSPIDSTSPLSNGQKWSRMPDVVTNNYGVTRTAWIGDSLSANTVASTSSTQVYPRAPERYATLSSRTVDNWAVNGATLLTDVAAQWTTYGSRTNASRIVIWGGINDIIIGGVAGHTLWTNFLTFVRARIAESRTVVLVNLTPFKNYSGWSAGLETEKDNFNSDMATYCSSNDGGSLVLCIDMAASLAAPGDPDTLDSGYSAPDGLHLSQTGATAAGNFVYAGAP